MKSCTELLQALVQIPSINPEGASPEALETGHYGELALAQYLAPLLSEAGFEVTLEEVEPKRPNLIARAPGSNDRPRILFGPHLDTVGIENMTIPPFGAEIRDGKLWGRGASDTKGTMASMIWGLIQNADKLAQAPVALDFVAFMGEETRQLGAKHFAKHHGEEYEFAIAGEPTKLQIVHCTKGCIWGTFSSAGVAVHASQPTLGENAIHKLLKALPAIEAGLEQKFETQEHTVLGRSTWNLGLIEGGVRPNVVPDQASFTVDIRTIPALWAEGGAAPLLQRLANAQNLKFSYYEESPPMDVSAEHPWILAIQEAHPQSACVGAPWFSDAAHLNAGGIPAICLGPGDIAQAHTEDEYITLEDLEGGATYFTTLISALTEPT